MRVMRPGELPYTFSERMARIPHQVYRVADALRHGDRWRTSVYLVGGIVRDFLAAYWEDPCFVKNGQWVPTGDWDLTTNLTEEQILERLRTPYAVDRGIKVHEKQSVDTFGVVFVHCEGLDIEVAPFRKDVGSADGRRPASVEKGLIYDDAARRDLTINSLYFDLHEHRILDFNVDDDGMHGAGIMDVKHKRVRTVGDPFDRFDEDKLRVLRLVRFFSRLNDGPILPDLDLKTAMAVKHYKNLRQYKGITGERIMMEFLAGLKQSLNTSRYLLNYIDLELMPAVFPGLEINYMCVPRLGNLKNAKVVLACLLRKNKKVSEALNELKYPNDISEPVQFLIDCLDFEAQNAVEVLKARDRRLVKPGKKTPVLDAEALAHNEAVRSERQQDLADLCSILDDSDRIARIEHMRDYDLWLPSGESLMAAGFKGEEIGREQTRQGREAYVRDYSWFLARKASELCKSESPSSGSSG